MYRIILIFLGHLISVFCTAYEYKCQFFCIDVEETILNMELRLSSLEKEVERLKNQQPGFPHFYKYLASSMNASVKVSSPATNSH